MMIKRYLRFCVALCLLVIAGACGKQLESNLQSRERYRKSYERSGGFDPISKSVRQNMR
jgi:hypothetical protein